MFIIWISQMVLNNMFIIKNKWLVLSIILKLLGTTNINN